MNPSTQLPPHYPRPSYPPVQRRDGPGYALQIIQQPERGKVVIKGKDKDRKPIDPPPILQLHANSVDNPCPFWFNPYLFCTVTLFDSSEDHPKEQDDDRLPTLVGASASSLHRLKDLTNTEGAFFVFGDLAATVVGKARLHFCLYELEPHTGHAVMVQATTSHIFDVQVPRDWEGVKESTILSRTFSDQGVKLRLRKESRAAQRRRSFHPQPTMPTMPQPPLRPHPSIHGGYHDTHAPLRSQPPGSGNYNDPQHNIRPHSSTQGSFDENAEDDLDERDSKRPRNYATSAALNYPSQATAAAYGQGAQQGSYGGGVATPEQNPYSNAPAAHPSYGPPQTPYGQPPAQYGQAYQQYPQSGYPQPYGSGNQYGAAPSGPGPYGSGQYPNYSQGMGYGGYGAPGGQQWGQDHYNQQHGALPNRSGYSSATSGAPTLPSTSSIAGAQQSHLSTSMQTNRLPPLANLPNISAPPVAQNQPSATSGHTSPHAQQSGSGSGLSYTEA